MPDYKFNGLSPSTSVKVYAYDPTTGGRTGSVLATQTTDAAGSITVTLPDGQYLAEDTSGGEVHRTAGEKTTAATLTGDIDPVAAGADSSTVLGEAPYAGTVTRVAYVPNTTLTGANTDSRTVTLKNRGQAGAGTTTVATLAFVSGVNATGDDAKAITLSGTPANLVIVAGDVLSWESTHVGSTGLADPGGQVIVEISRS